MLPKLACVWKLTSPSSQIVRHCLKRMQTPKLVHVVTSSVQLPPEENRKRGCRKRARRAIAAAVEERAPSSPPLYDAHSAAKPPYPQPRRVMRPALTTLPPKACSANPFSLAHVAATQEIRESFVTLTATMVVKPTPPFCLLAATTISAAA
jgi:hypothetical protein